MKFNMNYTYLFMLVLFIVLSTINDERCAVRGGTYLFLEFACVAAPTNNK